MSPIVVALEGELMLEKYLRYQHQRRNRRYLSNVRACQQEKEYNKAYKAEIVQLKSDLASAEQQLQQLRERSVIISLSNLQCCFKRLCYLKVKKLQNQVLVVNDLRSYQCEIINGLKPFTYFTKGISETPDVTNLKTLADETQKKFENGEIEVRKQQAIRERLTEEIAVLKEKLQKQKNLTEKTTNLWEQKYSSK
eukprot:sb/3470916/